MTAGFPKIFSERRVTNVFPLGLGEQCSECYNGRNVIASAAHRGIDVLMSYVNYCNNSVLTRGGEVIKRMQHMIECKAYTVIGVIVAAVLVVGSCGRANYPVLPTTDHYGSIAIDPDDYQFLIGPGDELQIFVWRNPEVSQTVTVRPDGKITMPLVEDLQASGKTSTQLARDIEAVLETYIRQPIVSVIVSGGVGPYAEQVRVVGQATKPQALSYREQMTLLDLMILVGGTTEFAAGNNATLVRVVNGEQKQFRVRIDDLLKDGDISANVDILPGDVLIIPESWF